MHSFCKYERTRIKGTFYVACGTTGLQNTTYFSYSIPTQHCETYVKYTYFVTIMPPLLLPHEDRANLTHFMTTLLHK